MTRVMDVPAMTRSALLAAYDAQLRGVVVLPLPGGVQVVRDGPLLRFTGLASGGFIEYRDLEGLEGASLDDLIARQVRAFAERGESFEWKLHAHDLPSDLPGRLRSAGFVAEETETVVIAPVSAVVAAPALPQGVVLREVTERLDFERIAARSAAIWHDDRDAWLADSLEAEHRVDPEGLTIVVAEAGAIVVCAAWVRFAPATEFATLWGGGTLAAWRGRGIYRALVAYRAQLAADRGCRYLQVDASDDSRPILERLGFVPVTTTTPFIWTPPDRDASA